MPDKVQTRDGRHLADIYKVKGSRVGIENLYGSEVQIVHEMGAELASERYRWQILYSTQAPSQSTNVLDTIVPPHDLFNVLAVEMLVSDGDQAKVDWLSLSLSNQSSTEHTIWTWDSTAGGLTQPARGVRVPSGGTADYELFIPLYERLPIQAIGPPTNSLPGVFTSRLFTVRGLTTAFGAGTINLYTKILVEHTSEVNENPRRIESRGLPPVW